MKSLVPDTTCLLHAVEAFHKAHDPVFFARGFEAAWLFHEHRFIGREDAVKESSFDIEMLEVPVESGSEVENGAERFKADGWGSCLVVVNAVLLGKPFGDIADFVTNDVAGVVVFAFADKFPFERALTRWDVGFGDENEYFEILEAFEFFAATGNPVFALR